MYASQSIIAVLALALSGALFCLVLPRPHDVLKTIVGVSAVELLLALNIWAAVLGPKGFVTAADQWFYIDAFSSFHIVVLTLVFALSSAFASIYFTHEAGDLVFTAAVARRFGVLWLGAQAAMLLVLMSNNLGIMWVGMEATTLLTAFLISLHPSRLSLEAMWKYLIICSIGIAFAFMGTLLAAASIQSDGGAGADALFWTKLASAEAHLDPILMKFAFIFVLVGYGTKAGLAPIHSWLPDAHSQAPAPVSAMFSGFLLNTALYCIMRFVPPVQHALGQDFASSLLIVFGTLSILVAAGFIVFNTTPSDCSPITASNIWASSRWATPSVPSAALRRCSIRSTIPSANPWPSSRSAVSVNATATTRCTRSPARCEPTGYGACRY